MHTQQMQPHKVGDVTGFNEVATRGGAAAVELLNQMLRTCSPPRPRKTAGGKERGGGTWTSQTEWSLLRDGGG